MIKKLALGLLCGLLFITTASLPLPSLAAGQAPTFVKVVCRFQIPKNQTVQCGDLIVPEVRTKPTGPTIRIHVAIFKARSANPLPDPIIYLEGGPGGQALGNLPSRLAAFAPYMQDRDLIMFDQRGVGYSRPALDCPEMIQSDYKNAATGALSQAAGDLAALKQCHDRLAKLNIDFSAYNSEENAADVADLRVALGYKSWNLYGISYGTRLALVTMRDFPTGIRSVVLDSTFPLDQHPSRGASSLQLIFSTCANDRSCNADFPRLRSVYQEVLLRLSTKPVKITLPKPNSSDKVTLLIDSNLMQEAIFEAMYSRDLIPALPDVIYETRNGNYTLIGQLALRILLTDERISQGMYYSVMCADHELGTMFCKTWGVSPSPTFKAAPVNSSIPTIVMAGEYDPVTPPNLNLAAARALSHSYYFLFPGYGHGVTVTGTCPASIMLAFLANPTHKPDSSCIANVTEPKWESAPF